MAVVNSFDIGGCQSISNENREKPFQIESDYVVEVNSWDGDIEALYEARGPGRMFAAGLVPKYGGGPKR